MKDGDCAGLIALQKEYGFVGIRKEGNTSSILMVANSNEMLTESHKIPIDKNRVYFRIDCDFNPVNENQRNDKAYFYYSLDGKKWTRIGGPLQMVYSWPYHFMGYRFGLFNFATKVTGGYVDFDYFRVKDNMDY